MKKMAVLAIGLLAAAVTGCPIAASAGADLSARGIVSLLISRESTSASAYAGASVRDNAALLTLLELADDQVLSVDGVALRPTLVSLLFGLGLDNTQVGAKVGAVSTPESYAVTFDNQGKTASMTVTPPSDFTSVTPAAGTQVARTGFTVTWSPSGETDVLIDIVIEGLEPDGQDNDSNADTAIVTLSNLPNSGAATVSASDLGSLLNGAITVTVRRFRTFTQSLGFASGDIRVEVFRDITLTLTD